MDHTAGRHAVCRRHEGKRLIVSTAGSKLRRPRILLVQRAEVELYPPVLHQAGILREIGDVTIIDSGPTGAAVMTASDVKRLRIAEYPSGARTTFSRMRKLMEFRRAVRRAVKDAPQIVIAFDPDAAAAVLDLARQTPTTRCVVHMHEDLDLANWAGSRSSMWAIKKMIANIHRAAFVVSADSYRAERLEKAFGPGVKVETVMNCPRLMRTIPQSRLLPFLEEKAPGRPGVAHYQGAVGPHHGLEVIIKSMSKWPADTRFAIVGPGSDSYVRELTALASENGVAERVHFLGKVAYDQVMSFAAGATLGMTLLDTRHDNWLYAAGASNKRFEYAALGIPQVTNNGPGIDDLFVDRGIALTADYSSSESVARTVSWYLENTEARVSAGAKARALHLSTYNYEHEFAPILRSLGLS